MSEDLKFIESTLMKNGVEELSFRILPILKDALELYKMDYHYPSSLRDLYAYLTQEEFYHAYQPIFNEVLTKAIPRIGQMGVDDLNSFGISSNRYAQICSGSKQKISILVPKLPIQACNYISICLGWNKSAAMVYRSLTERILIYKLHKQIDTLLKLEEYSKHHCHIQL